MNSNIITYLQEKNIAYEEHVDLKKRTWIHRGGIAKLWIVPISIEELICVCQQLYKDKITFKIIGQTSNLYFKNSYNPSIIINTLKLSHFYSTEDEIICECGVPVKKLARHAIENGIVGFEGLVDLPGTIGAATCNNSSCYQCSVSSLLRQAEVLTPNGLIKTLHIEDFEYKERSSIFKRGKMQGVILNIHLKKTISTDRISLLAIAEQNHQHRLTHQEKPTNTLGSIFPMTTYRAFEKNLSLWIRCFIYITEFIKNCHIISELQFTKAKRDIILVCSGLWSIRHYVSDYTFNCFIWKDANADDAFLKYQYFVLKTAQNNGQTEIEIIDS